MFASMRRPARILLLAVAALLALAVLYIGALAAIRGPVAAFRILTSLSPGLSTWRIFPQREVMNAAPVSSLGKAEGKSIPEAVAYEYRRRTRTERLADLLARTDTKAFIVIRDDKVLFEAYPDGGSRDTLYTSFSIAKSIMSALVGIAIEEGKIGGVQDEVVKYIPELRGRGLDSLTIRDMLTMSSGIPFRVSDEGISVLDLPFLAFGEDARQYYSTDLRADALSLRAGDEPAGAYFRYDDWHAILEGMILERATGGSISSYLQEKLWKPAGMEYPASYSLDSAKDGFEKVNASFNARAIDFARFGLVFLHRGFWNGRRILPEAWVDESTSPDPGDRRPWKVYKGWKNRGGYYKYHWWGLVNPDGSYDYVARGVRGQTLYISPTRDAVVLRLGGDPDPYVVWPFVARSLLSRLSR